MNTPTHMIVNYALLADSSVSKKEKWSVILGGLIPDIVIFFLFFYALAVGIPQRVVWSELYFSDGWQLAIDILNSLPIFLALAFIGWIIKKRWLILFSLSMCIHFVFDFFTHADDAHRHFLPFSDFRFESVLSYWDRDHFGTLGACIEIALLGMATTYLWSRVQTRWIRWILLAYILVSFLFIFISKFFFG